MSQLMNSVGVTSETCDRSATGNGSEAIATFRDSRLVSRQILRANPPAATPPSTRGTTTARYVFMTGLGLAAWVALAAAITAWVQTSFGSRPADDPAARQKQDVAIARHIDQVNAYRGQVKSLGQNLAAGTCTLAAAVKQLENSDALAATNMMPSLRQRLPGRSDAECLAATLMEAALQAETSPVAVEHLTARLRAEFQATYHHPAPKFRWKTLDSRAAA